MCHISVFYDGYQFLKDVLILKLHMTSNMTKKLSLKLLAETHYHVFSGSTWEKLLKTNLGFLRDTACSVLQCLLGCCTETSLESLDLFRYSHGLPLRLDVEHALPWQQFRSLLHDGRQRKPERVHQVEQLLPHESSLPLLWFVVIDLVSSSSCVDAAGRVEHTVVAPLIGG